MFKVMINLVIVSCVIAFVTATLGDDKFASWFAQQQEEVLDDLLPVEVAGKIPSFVDGKLIRVGPSVIETEDKNYTNFLDAFGRVTSWTLSGTTNTAYFQSAIIKSLLWNHSKHDQSIARHITQQKTEPSTRPGIFSLDEMDNTDVNVYKFKNSNNFLTFTDFYISNEVHLDSLRTIGSAKYNDSESIPENGFFSSSHPEEFTHPSTGTVYLINWLGVKTARGSTVYIYAMDEHLSRTVVGSVDIDFLPYSIHSIALVDGYLAVVVAPVSIDFLKAGANLCLTCSYTDNLATLPTTVYVFSLEEVGRDISRAPVVTVEIPPPNSFFTFHHVNGWLEADRNVLVLDMCSYDDMDGVLGHNTLGNLADILDPSERDTMEYLCDSLKRIRLELLTTSSDESLNNSSSGKATTVTSLLSNEDIPLVDAAGKIYRLDFLTVNPAYKNRQHCFVYGIGHHIGGEERYEDMGLVKVDTCVEEVGLPTVVQVLHWPDVYLGEPVFISPAGVAPAASTSDRSEPEDYGSLLMVTRSGSDGTSSLMIIDAATFDTQATMEAPFPLMFEFHGQFFPVED
jgi:carotenoid cleavage dioxygenase-like enzyme